MNRIEKFSWEEIKEELQQINATLFQLIEEINPDKSLPFFIANYDFGEHFGVKNHAYLPTKTGKLEKIGSKSTDHELYQHLGYGQNSIPLGIILDKHCEWHHLSDDDRIFPDCVQGPGSIFNMQIIFDEDKTVENNTLSASSGALSAFMLPNIGCDRRHKRIQKYFDVSYNAPKSPFEHYLIFKDLIRDKNVNSNWQSRILYFSEQFVKEVRDNEGWLKLKLYFSESLRKKLTQNTYDAACNDLFLSAKKINRFRPTPFIIDTAKYIFNICIGSGIGVKPAIDESYFPLRDIQKIYHECYGLEHTPTIMVPATLRNRNDSLYYPLQCPFAKINAFKSNQSTSAIIELEKLSDVLTAYQEEFTEENGIAFGSLLYQVSKNTAFTYYHYKANDHKTIKNSKNLVDEDSGFSLSLCNDETTFASDAKLFRGCIRIQVTN